MPAERSEEIALGSTEPRVLGTSDAEFIDDPVERSGVVAALLSNCHSEAAMGSPSPTMLPVG